jgi:hypothetical protein
MGPRPKRVPLRNVRHFKRFLREASTYEGGDKGPRLAYVLHNGEIVFAGSHHDDLEYVEKRPELLREANHMGFLEVAAPSGKQVFLIHGPKSDKYNNLPHMPPEVMDALESYVKGHLKTVHKKDVRIMRSSI